jgi:hypothetical protein
MTAAAASYSKRESSALNFAFVCYRERALQQRGKENDWKNEKK